LNFQKKILLVGLYPNKAACTRLRLFQIPDYIDSTKWVISKFTTIQDKELDSWISGGFKRLIILIRIILRIPSLIQEINDSNLIFIQREILPLNILMIEKYIKRKKKTIIWDLDDALWINTSRIRGFVRGRVGKYIWYRQNSHEIWAGSPYIMNWAHTINSIDNVYHLPTLPMQHFKEAEPKMEKYLIWIGTPSTYKFFEEMYNSFSKILGRQRILVIGAGKKIHEIRNIEYMDWSIENEAFALNNAKAGLYPIDPNFEYGKGKAGLKAFMYLAHGITVIAPDCDLMRRIIPETCGYFYSDKISFEQAINSIENKNSRSKVINYYRSFNKIDEITQLFGVRVAKLLSDF